ncbi:MAG: OmpA family protein [Alkalispirochaeta sp.]
MKQNAWRLLIVASVLVIGSCATTGEISLDLGDEREFYISPRNQDGVQDALSLPTSVLPVDRSVITYFRIDVLDVGGNPVYSFEETAEPRRWYQFRRPAAVVPPDLVLWDGTTQSGDWAFDGPYRVAVEVRDNRDRTERLEDIVVFVDNLAPFVDPSVAFPRFSPNGDGRLDTIAIFQRRSSVEDEWVGELLDSASTVRHRWTWSGAALDVVWDGTDDTGTILPSGTYTYRVSSTDRAGNPATYNVPDIILDTVPRAISVSVDKRIFSPNGDGVQDTLSISVDGTSRDTVSRALLSIVEITGDTVRDLRLTAGTSVATFDGADNNGTVLPDGQYHAVLLVEYRNGDEVSTASPVFELDTTPPVVAVSTDYRLFSPDGDGRRDAITIRQSSSFDIDGLSVGEIVGNGGTVIRRYEWEGAAADIVWDGTDTAGALAPNGTYLYRVESYDSAGNSTRVSLDAIRLDARPTPVSVRAGAAGFSPNEDGLFDTLPLTVGIPTDIEVDEWTLSVRDRNRTSVYTLQGTGTPMTPTVEWTGQLSGSDGTASDGTYDAMLTVVFEKGNISTATSRTFMVDTRGPAIDISLPPERFSPDDDGINDILNIGLAVRDSSLVTSWDARILDPFGQPFWHRTGDRSIPRQIAWDGRSATGERVQSTTRYPIEISATDVYGNVGSASSAVNTDILVLQQGDSLRIVLSSINFAPFTAEYRNLAPQIVRNNLATLDRVTEVLARYPTSDIRIEGHAVSLLWADPVRARREQDEVLMPLSRSRAEAIRNALIQRGIEPARITAYGSGGSRPVVPHGDEANRWKSRRVEFVLEER